VLIILNNVKIKVDERTQSGLESLSLSQKTINRKQYVLIFLFEVSYLKIDPIIYCGFEILHDYELVYYVLRLFGLNIVNA